MRSEGRSWIRTVRPAESRGWVTSALQRRHLTALACGLWLFGFDLVPLAHMLFHDALDHHEHGHHHHESPDHDDEPPTPSEHGEGSVAHRDLAAKVPPPAVPPVREALQRLSFPPEANHEDGPSVARMDRKRARAPPGETA